MRSTTNEKQGQTTFFLTHADRKRGLSLILCLASLVLAGCASLSEEECMSANWYAVGLEDGAQGRPLERLGDHRRACAEYKVAPQAEQYMAGRSEGLKSFCTYDRGYAHGRAGHGYAAVCPVELARNFVAGYERGRELHDLERRVHDVHAEIARVKAALKEGIPNPRLRAREVERLEDLTREAAQLEERLGTIQR